MSYYYTINNIQNIYHHISSIDFFNLFGNIMPFLV